VLLFSRRTNDFVRWGMKTSRRDFVKLSAIGLAAQAASAFPASPNWFAPATPGAISTWVTNDKLRYAVGAPLAWKQAANVSGDRITLNPAEKFQEILGLAAAFPD